MLVFLGALVVFGAATEGRFAGVRVIAVAFEAVVRAGRLVSVFTVGACRAANRYGTVAGEPVDARARSARPARFTGAAVVDVAVVDVAVVDVAVVDVAVVDVAVVDSAGAAAGEVSDAAAFRADSPE